MARFVHFRRGSRIGEAVRLCFWCHIDFTGLKRWNTKYSTSFGRDYSTGCLQSILTSAIRAKDHIKIFQNRSQHRRIIVPYIQCTEVHLVKSVSVESCQTLTSSLTSTQLPAAITLLRWRARAFNVAWFAPGKCPTNVRVYSTRVVASSLSTALIHAERKAVVRSDSEGV